MGVEGIDDDPVGRISLWVEALATVLVVAVD